MIIEQSIITNRTTEFYNIIKKGCDIIGTYKRKKYPIKCKTCESIFMAYKKGKSTKKYCSKECIPTSIRDYNCEICDKVVRRTKGNIKKRIFCSVECANKGKIGIKINTKDNITLECKYCYIEFNVLPCYKNRMFCSTKCRDKYRRAGIKKMPLRNIFEKNRVTALERDLFKCRDCGMSDEEHRIRYGRGLNVHHIIPYPFYKRDNIMQHDISNLKSLCTPCHILIHSTELIPHKYDKSKFETI